MSGHANLAPLNTSYLIPLIHLQHRRMRLGGPHPLPLRVLASLYGSLIRAASETGRLKGHMERHGAWGAVRRSVLRFDWFCGLLPGVVARERGWALARFACYAATLWAVGACLLGPA